MKIYAAMTMKPHPLPHWVFFLALSHFRMASIVQVLPHSPISHPHTPHTPTPTHTHTHTLVVQGVYSRGIQGNASSSIALFYKNLVQPLAEAGCALIRTAESSPAVLDFVGYSQRAKVTLSKLKGFMREHVYPAEAVSPTHAHTHTH